MCYTKSFLMESGRVGALGETRHGFIFPSYFSTVFSCKLYIHLFPLHSSMLIIKVNFLFYLNYQSTCNQSVYVLGKMILELSKSLRRPVGNFFQGERTRAGLERQRGKERGNLKQASRSAWSPVEGPVLPPRDHDLSQNQELETQLTAPLRRPVYLHLLLGEILKIKSTFHSLLNFIFLIMYLFS